MAFRHGVYTEEAPTSLISPVQGESDLPVIIGTAPIHLAADDEAIKNVNKPQLVYSYDEAVKFFGFSRDWEKYTLCEFIYSQFVLYGMSHCVLINVLDSSKHNETVSGRQYAIADGEVNLGADVIISGGQFEAASLDIDEDIDSGATKTIYRRDVDYSLVYDDEGNAILNVLSGGALSGKLQVYLTFTKIKPKVAAVMRAKAENINGIFMSNAVVDIPCDAEGADIYTEAPEWKNRNNYMSEHQIVCWPRVKLGDNVFHLSTQLTGLMNSIDNGNEDVPSESPSNKKLQMNACVNASGKEIDLGLEQANYLNGQGIVTALNWIGGWRAWGNRTAAYPSVTDVKDSFISVRRMFDWIRNDFTQTFWSKVDNPTNQRLINSILNSYNVMLNGLAASGMILGGRIVFRSEDNPTTDLLSGITKFYIHFTPTIPAEQVIGIVEYDPDYLEILFTA